MMFDRMRDASDQAKLSFRLAELDEKAARIALNDTKLLAPYDGVVTMQRKHESEFVNSGEYVLELYDLSSTEISFSAPEQRIGDITPGNPIEVHVPARNTKFETTISRMIPVVTDRGRTFQVFASLPQAQKNLPPGVFIEVVLNAKLL
jgi:multidrug resistance efflux pump